YMAHGTYLGRHIFQDLDASQITKGRMLLCGGATLNEPSRQGSNHSACGNLDWGIGKLNKGFKFHGSLWVIRTVKKMSRMCVTKAFAKFVPVIEMVGRRV